MDTVLQEQIQQLEIDLDTLPKHIAIIMDGNGRWAEAQKKPRHFGHQQGYKTLTDVITHCNNLGVSYLSVYAFSTENWTRPKKEVSFLMTLLKTVLKKELHQLIDNKVRLKFLGDKQALGKDVLELITMSEAKTAQFEGLQVNIMFNYGSKHELVQAVQGIVEDGTPAKEITEELISEKLYTNGIPDPDILIRPGGEHRISNFMFWQCAYAELFFIDKFWPEFTCEDLLTIIAQFQKRDRRFGGLTT